MIPGVEHLCPKLQSRRLSRRGKDFSTPRSQLVDAWTVENRWPAIPEIAHARRRKAGRVEPQEAVVAYIAGELVVAPVANTIRERGDERASRLVGPSQIDRLPGREDGDRCDRPPAKRHVCPTISTSEGDLPYCARTARWRVSNVAGPLEQRRQFVIWLELTLAACQVSESALPNVYSNRRFNPRSIRCSYFAMNAWLEELPAPSWYSIRPYRGHGRVPGSQIQVSRRTALPSVHDVWQPMRTGSQVGQLHEIVPADTLLHREIPLTRITRSEPGVQQRDQRSRTQAAGEGAGQSSRRSRREYIDAQCVCGRWGCEAVCETLARSDRRRRRQRVGREEPRELGVIDAGAGADHGRLAKTRLPGQAESGRKVVPVRLHDPGTDLSEARVGD